MLAAPASMPGWELLPPLASLDRQQRDSRRGLGHGLPPRGSPLRTPWTRHEALVAAQGRLSLQLQRRGRWSAREWMGSGHPWVPSRAEHLAAGVPPPDFAPSPPATPPSPLQRGRSPRPFSGGGGSPPSADLAKWHAWPEGPRPPLPRGIVDYVRERLPYSPSPASCAPTPPPRVFWQHPLTRVRAPCSTPEIADLRTGSSAAPSDAGGASETSTESWDDRGSVAGLSAQASLEDLGPSPADGVQAEQVAAELDASAKPPVDGGSAPEAARADPPVPEPVAFADPSIRVELARALAGSVQDASPASPAGAAALSAEEQAHCLQLMRGCSLFRLCPQVQLSQIVGRLSRASHRRLLYVIALQEDEEERAAVVNQATSAPEPEAPVAAIVAKHEVQSRQEEPEAQSAAALETEGAEPPSEGDLVSCLIHAVISEVLDELGGAQVE